MSREAIASAGKPPTMPCVRTLAREVPSVGHSGRHWNFLAQRQPRRGEREANSGGSDVMQSSAWFVLLLIKTPTLLGILGWFCGDRVPE